MKGGTLILWKMLFVFKLRGHFITEELHIFHCCNVVSLIYINTYPFIHMIIIAFSNEIIGQDKQPLPQTTGGLN